MLQVSEGMVLADRYAVGRKLGAGGSGSVWHAMDQVLERPVAIKVVPDGVGAARLAREARAGAGIGVRNVVAVYDVGEQDGAHFLVMEFVDGVDLATLLAVHGPLPEDVAALVGHEVARGVSAVHAASLVHRDVTPGNVLVTVEGEVKLTDLGIAHRTGEGATRRLTEVGTVVGTVDYLAPEQVQGHDVTPASDVYAVGLLLFEAVTGRAAFGDGSVPERLARRLHAPPPTLEGDPRLAAVVSGATTIDPEDRFADGSALRAALAPLVPDDDRGPRARLATMVAEAQDADPVLPPATTDAGIAVALPSPRRAAATPPVEPAPPAEAEPNVDVGATTVSPVTNHTVVPEPEPGPAPPPAAAPPPTPAPAREVASTPPPVPDAVPPSADATALIPAARDRHGELVDGQDDRGAAGPTFASAASRAALGAVAVVVLIALASAIGSGGGGDGGEDGGSGDDPAGAQALPIAAAFDHDPLGGGDEHPEDVPLAIDGDEATEWDTEGYESAALGGLKSGVGLLLDLGEVRSVSAVDVLLGLDDVDLTVTVSQERPGGDPTDGGTALGDGPVEGRWVALWFTRLADDGGRFRAAVREVTVLGD